MDNRTYRYFKGIPLYGFGYGLSYTTFRYDQLQLPATLPKGKSIHVSARVTNTGSRDGEDVVQLYLSHTGQTIKAPLRALKGFRRLFLKAGESRIVQFELTPQDIAVVDNEGRLREPPGNLLISIGGSQPDEQTKTDQKTVTGTVLASK